MDSLSLRLGDLGTAFCELSGKTMRDSVALAVVSIILYAETLLVTDEWLHE